MKHCEEIFLWFSINNPSAQIDNSSVVLMSSHSTGNTEKYGLLKLSVSFISSQMSMASNSITDEKFEVFWALLGPTSTRCCGSVSPLAICNSINWL